MSNIVFVSHEIPVDYSHAEAFGELRFVIRDAKDIDNLSDSVNNKEVLTRTRRVLADYDPNRDYLLISGSPYVGALCAFIIGTHHSKIRFLRWSGIRKMYFPLEFVTIKERVYETREKDPGQPLRADGDQRAEDSIDSGS